VTILGESGVSMSSFWEVVLMDDMLYVTQFPMQIFTESTVVSISRVWPQFLVLRVDLTFYFLPTTATH